MQKLATKIKKESDRVRSEKNRVVAEWVYQTPPTPPKAMNRIDSYMETLAGPFFPPDAHDFNAKQRALVMAAEANQGYDQYWKKRHMDKIILQEKDEPFSWNSIENLRNNEKVNNGGKSNFLVNLDSSKVDASSKFSRTTRINKAQINGTHARFALVMSRALGHGGLPPTVALFPKIERRTRPHTVCIPTVTMKDQTRPFTSVDRMPLSAHEKRMRDLQV